jgi:hypothetical protein
MAGVSARHVMQTIRGCNSDIGQVATNTKIMPVRISSALSSKSEKETRSSNGDDDGKNLG